jgi:cellulose synthase/poly-beta-1,6-N-acetylglucosamine synthase-like glycosyltransferase
MMCNGANLAYEKTAFYEVQGFAGIDAIASGDDMLLMHKIFTRFPNRVMFLKSKNAIVKTAPLKTLSQFLSQRIRWASKADRYQDKKTFPVLLLVYLFNLSLLVLPVIAFFLQNTFMIIFYWLLLLFGKTIIELFFLFPVAFFFEKRKLLWWFPLMQPFHIFYTVIAGFLGKFSTYEWKGRKVK